MKIKIILSFIVFTFLFGALGQDYAAIDSLLNILRTARADTTKVNCMNAISFQYKNISDFKTAMQYADSALELAQTLDYEKGIIESFNNTVHVHAVTGFLPEALEDYFDWLNIFDEIGNKKGIYFCYNNMGLIYQNQGNFAEALKNYFAVLEVLEEIGNKVEIAGAYFNIGVVYADLGNHQEALEYFLSSMKVFEETGGKYGITICYNRIGEAYANLGNPSEALENFFDALKINEDGEDKLSIADSYNNIGLIYQNQGNYTEALKKHIAALEIFEKRGYKKGAASSYNYIGTIYQKQGNYKDARKYLEDGLAVSREIRSKPIIKDNYKALSFLDSAEGLYAQALEHYKMYTLYKDSLINEESNNQIALLKIQYETEKKDREIELLNKDKAMQEQKLEKQRIVRNGMIAGVFLIVLVGLLLFRSFRLGKKLEKQQAILQERKRISSDLHDDVGSGLSKITLLSELLKTQAKTPENRKEAEKISETALQLSSTLSEIIWALNSNNDYLENMVAYIRRYAAEYFENSPVKLKIVTSGEILHTPINGEHRRNIFYTVKEALNNILKHAEATEAELKFVVINNKLDVIISDNGKGMPDGDLNRFGNGIKNMRARMKSISGDFKIERHQGTRIILKLAI